MGCGLEPCPFGRVMSGPSYLRVNIVGSILSHIEVISNAHFT